MAFDYPRWSKLPYTGEKNPPKNPEEPLAGSWPLIFLKRDGMGWFTDPLGNPIPRVKDPNSIDWKEQLKQVQRTLADLSPVEQLIADYWGTGHVTKQWTPIIDRLIDTYTIYRSALPPLSLATPEAGRILAITQGAINDALILCWAVKYRYDAARPNQQDHDLPTYLCTPRHPTYISAHAIVGGVVSEVLIHFFPAEKERLQELAEQCAIARVYGGVHYPIDSSEGLRLGRAIGRMLADYFTIQTDAAGNSVDRQFTEDRNAELPPGPFPFEQAIPYPFVNFCQSAVIEESIVDRIVKFFLRIFKRRIDNP
ncbi:vanadium-dependent haloperoxidase [Neobacillus dielmonensis]|uniref:vanadium-dependent haloperoxidase n=1 Tax=Neobacillus dielmonensis TaxID=1347369 RepID=UPI0005A9A700|nr:vanadium-dependent haloperoxidase [Neobacillus dielmonensis]